MAQYKVLTYSMALGNSVLKGGDIVTDKDYEGNEVELQTRIKNGFLELVEEKKEEVVEPPKKKEKE